MHPEILRAGPGSCPICGMALEPREPGADDEANPELGVMTRRFWISLALTLPILALMISGWIPGDPLQRLLGPASLWIQFALATPAVLWGGAPFFQRGWESVLNRRLNMFTLIAIGTGAAYFYSVFALLFPGLIPGSFRSMGGELAIYFEPAAVIV